MGERGPLRKRDAERRRTNTPDTATIKVDLSELIAMEVDIPAPNGDWHPIALEWYMSLAKSGQAIFYEPSDWSAAFVLAETLSRALNPIEVKTGEREIETQYGEADDDGEYMWRKTGKDYVFEAKYQVMNAATLNAILKGMSDLMTTEAHRRRLQMELDREKVRQGATGGNVIPIVQERNARFGKS